MLQQLTDRPTRDIGWVPYAWLIYLLFFFAPLVVDRTTTFQVVASRAPFPVSSQCSRSSRPPFPGVASSPVA